MCPLKIICKNININFFLCSLCLLHINCIKISENNSIIVFSSKGELIIFDVNNKEIKKIDSTKYSSFDIIDIYICKNLSIKLAFKNGTILSVKNDKISIIRKFRGIFGIAKFSPKGEILILYDRNIRQIKFIHEKDQTENITIENIRSNNLCLSQDSKFLITEYKRCVNKYDISDIGNKTRNQISTFLTMMEKDNSDELSNFKNNCLFDHNILPLIFDFLPFETENFMLKK